VYLGHDAGGSKRPAALNAMAFLRRALPPTLQYNAASLLGERVQDWVVNRSLIGGRDWTATPSFPILSGGEGLIRLNVKGRETPGFFEPESAELHDYVEWLKTRLQAIQVSGTREPLIRRIEATADVFPGERRDLLPDLILDWAPEAPVHRIASPDIGEIEVSLGTGRGGNHNALAFLIAKGGEALLEATAQARGISDLGRFAEALLCPQARMEERLAG
jgi:hypothetical protein